MWISNSFLTLLLNFSCKFWFSNSEVLREFGYHLFPNLDLCPADVSSCVNGVELCVGYGHVETQRIVWEQAKHCCLQWAKFELKLPKVQKLAHFTSPGKCRLQNHQSFSKENAVIIVPQVTTTWAYCLFKVEGCMVCQCSKTPKASFFCRLKRIWSEEAIA